MNSLVLLLIGVVLIVVGLGVYKQPWTTPAMFAGLGLDLSKTIVNVGLFLVFIQIINVYFYAPLKEAMDERHNELESTFTDAENLRTQMTSMKSDYEQRLAKTEADAREQIQGEIKKAQELRAQLEADARNQAEDYKRKAIAEIDNEKNRVIADLRLHVVNLSLGATERILGENVDTDRNRKLVDEFIDKLEVPV